MNTPLAATIAVTGMNATDNPAPGVPVARALRLDPNFHGRIIGLGYDPLDPGFYASGLLDGGAILPLPSAGRDALLHRMRELVAQFGITVFIPTLDSEIRAVALLRDELLALGVHTFLPTIDAIDRSSKPQLPKLGTAPGVRIPDSEPLMSEDSLGKLIKKFGLPVVVKGVYYGAYVCHTEADALASFRYYEATWGLPVIVQEHVDGDEYNVCALGDGTGAMIGAVAMRKLALTDKGKGWSGVTVGSPALLTLAAALIRALNWRGPLEVEIIAAKGEMTAEALRVIEINPRFPAWCYLTAAAGQNLPSACARLALGAPMTAPLPAYKTGQMFVRISLDQVADMATFGQLSALGILPFATPSA